MESFKHSDTSVDTNTETIPFLEDLKAKLALAHDPDQIELLYQVHQEKLNELKLEREKADEKDEAAILALEGSIANEQDALELISEAAHTYTTGLKPSEISSAEIAATNNVDELLQMLRTRNEAIAQLQEFVRSVSDNNKLFSVQQFQELILEETKTRSLIEDRLAELKTAPTQVLDTNLDTDVEIIKDEAVPEPEKVEVTARRVSTQSADVPKYSTDSATPDLSDVPPPLPKRAPRKPAYFTPERMAMMNTPIPQDAFSIPSKEVAPKMRSPFGDRTLAEVDEEEAAQAELKKMKRPRPMKGQKPVFKPAQKVDSVVTQTVAPKRRGFFGTLKSLFGF